MKKKTNKISVLLAITLVLALFLTGFFSASALSEEEEKYLEQELEELYKDRFADRMAEGKLRLERIKYSLDEEYKDFSDSLKATQVTEQMLVKVRSELNLLKQQLENINLQLDQTNEKISAIEMQILKKKSDLGLLYEEEEKIKAEADAQKEVVLKFFKLIQKENARLRDDEVKNTITLLLADSSFSSHLRNEMYLSSWEKTEREIFYNMELALLQVEETQKVLNQEKERLEELNAKLSEEKHNIEVQKQAKEDLIRQTQGKQKEYQRLWEESREQMEDSVQAIKDLRDDREMIREKLQILESQKQDAFMTVREEFEENESDENFEVGKIFEDADEGIPFVWPVDPSGGITAYYLDPSYEVTFGMKHHAIDIRYAQGKVIRAPALGYVYKVVDNGMGYSYIILAHKNNLTTLYGHVSKILVTEGDTVKEGEVIGLSGGTPGTKGAGVMTTGPHLHFEVFEDGEHVNPLDYLPIEELPIEYVPAEYLEDKRF